MKIRSFFAYTLAIFLFSCTKDPSDRVTEIKQITSSIEGNVILGQSIPWDPAAILIKCANRETTMDSSGGFFFKDISLNSKIETITVFFKGKHVMSKSFVPNEQHIYVRIEMWPEVFSGRVISTGSDYNSIEYGQTFHVQIPANSLSGSSYILKYEEATPSYELGYNNMVYGRLPGNFIAEDEQGNITGIQVMTKFFYLRAENASGSTIPLINGKKITVTKFENFETVIAPHFLYFLDQKKGTWKKISEASHNAMTKKFTATSDSINGFFVIARPFEVVKFTGKLIASNGYPVYSLVRINKVGEKNYSYVTYSNSKGEITGYLPKSVNTELSLIQSHPAGGYAYKYNELIFTKTVGSFSSDIDLGTITCFNMGDTANRAILTYKGKVVDCNNNPISGAVIVPVNLEKYPATVTGTNGEFAVNFTRGAPSFGADMIVLYNPSNNQRSQILYPLRLQKDATITSVDLGTIKICTSNTSEFMTFTVDGQTIDYRPPANPLHYYNPSIGIVDPTATTNEYVKSVSGNLFDVGFYGNFGVGSKKLSSFSVGFANIVQWLNTPIYLNITENRNTGSFYVAGSFQNLQVKYADGTTHRIDCNFRVKN